ARIKIGNNTITSPTNRFEGIVSGLTVEVKKEGNATVTVSEDYSKVSNFLSDFVRRYNAVVSQVNKLTAKDGIFQGDYGVAGIKSELSRMLDKLFAEDLVNIKEDGTLEANTSAVNSLANSNPNRLKEVVTDLQSKMGSYAIRTSTNLQTSSNDYQSRIDQIKQRAEILGEQLLREEERLKMEYAKVEVFMNRAQEVMDRLQAFMVSLSEATKKK
ncbi:MAG: flagellar filament capping protein FliD, partial [Aquificaceae bacterium]|nr:flagellar filament capping protein FliD [Aquificaceae bacterium]